MIELVSGFCQNLGGSASLGWSPTSLGWSSTSLGWSSLERDRYIR